MKKEGGGGKELLQSEREREIPVSLLVYPYSLTHAFSLLLFFFLISFFKNKNEWTNFTFYYKL